MHGRQVRYIFQRRGILLWTLSKYLYRHIRKILGKAVELETGNTCAYAEFWVGEEFSTFPNEDVRRVIIVPPTQEDYLALNETWCKQYIIKELGTVHDCHVLKVKENADTEKLRRGNLKIRVDVKESKAFNGLKGNQFCFVFESVCLLYMVLSI